MTCFGDCIDKTQYALIVCFEDEVAIEGAIGDLAGRHAVELARHRMALQQQVYKSQNHSCHQQG